MGRNRLGYLRSGQNAGRSSTALRVLLLAGWSVSAAGYLGPWIDHATAALTLSGVDMGEFVKFLPGVQSGSLPVIRQVFYLPAVAVAVSIAVLVGSRRLAYHRLLRALALMVGIFLSLQLLPPAWSMASLRAPEFRAQACVLVASWLLLAGFLIWSRAPAWLTGTVAGALALAAAGLAAWQFLVVKPAVLAVYQTTTSVGWGFALCLLGLATVAGVSSSLILTRPGWGRSWR